MRDDLIGRVLEEYDLSMFFEFRGQANFLNHLSI